MFYQLTASATAFTDFAVLDYRQRPFGAALRANLPSTVTATYTANYTLDDPQAQLIPTAITRSTTTASLTYANHGLNAGDYIRVTNAGAPFDGLYKVASVTSSSIVTYTVANSGLTTAKTTATFTPMRVTALTAFSAKTTAADGSISYPVRAVNLDVTAYSGTGQVMLEVLQGPSSA